MNTITKTLTKEAKGLPIITWINLTLSLLLIAFITTVAITQEILAKKRIPILGTVTTVDADNEAFYLDTPILPTWLSLSSVEFSSVYYKYLLGHKEQTINLAIENFGNDYNPDMGKILLHERDYREICLYRHLKKYKIAYLMASMIMLISLVTLQGYLLKQSPRGRYLK